MSEETTVQDSAESEVSVENVAPEVTGSDRLGEPGLKALQAERQANKDLKAQLAELTQFRQDKEAEGLSELEKLQKELKEASDGRSTAMQQLLRRDVAEAKGLTKEQAGFLVGSSEEELLEAADRLLAAFQTPEEEKPKGLTSRKPRELHAGIQPDEDATPNYGDIADAIAKKARF